MKQSGVFLDPSPPADTALSVVMEFVIICEFGARPVAASAAFDGNMGSRRDRQA
jgi:hypothetical protein